MQRTTIPDRTSTAAKSAHPFLPSLAPALCLASTLFLGSRTVLAMPQETKLPAEPTPVVELPVRAARPDVQARAQVPASIDTPPAVLLGATRSEHEQVCYDAPGDGSLWAVGATYKAGFDAEDSVYAPFLGSRAPQCYPVSFRLTQVALGERSIAFDGSVLPQRAGDVVRYERGGLVEMYELSPESVEQLFVFESLPEASAGGELVIRIAAETELVGREVEEGFLFENERGAVRYGRATALDAAGASVAAATTLTASGIEIRVPADFVARARLPLTIDPVVSTFTIDTTTRDSFYPDVAYDVATDRWLAVYEEIFSATDRDVRYRLLNASGASIQTGYVESSLTINWANPAVANNGNGDQFLVVAQVGLLSDGPRAIEGRIYSAALAAMQGGHFGISGSGAGYDMINPDVGGSVFGDYAVVWEREYSANDRDIFYRMVDVDGFGVGTGFLLIDNSGLTIDTGPSISKGNDGDEWNIVWQRQSGSQQDLRGARISNIGAITTPSFSIDSSIVSTATPKASTSLSGTDLWMVAFEWDFASDWDVGLIALNGSTVLDKVSLTNQEVLAGGLNTLFEDQLRPDIDSDGEAFAIAYSESVVGSATDRNVFVATAALTGTKINLSEGHKILAGSFTVEDFPEISSKEATGGALRRYMTVWHNVVNPAAHTDVEGGLYDSGLYTSFCNPHVAGEATCPCNNPPSTFGRGCNNSQNTGGGMLSLFGLSSLGGDTLNLFASSVRSNALSIFNQGDLVLASSVPFGQGARCVGGNVKRLYMTTSLAGGSASVPQGGDPNVHTRSAALGDVIAAGTTRGYYVYYRDPVVLGGCPSGSTFNTTQSVQAIWIP